MEFIQQVLSILGRRGQRLSRLLKTSIGILGKNISFVIPVLILFLIKLAEYGVYLGLLYHGFVTKYYDDVFNLGVVLFFILPGRMVIETFVQAFMAKKSYGVINGKHYSTVELYFCLIKNAFSLFFIGVISFLVKKLAENEGKGLLGFLAAILAFVVKEVWDLISNFGIPAIVIDDHSGKPFKQKLLELKSQIAEVMVGVICIDLMAGVVMSIFGGGTFIATFGGGALGYFYSDKFPAMMLTQFGEVTVNTFPTFFMLCLSFTFCALISAVGQATKTIYFTILYTALNHHEEIAEDYKHIIDDTLEKSNSDLAYN